MSKLARPILPAELQSLIDDSNHYWGLQSADLTSRNAVGDMAIHFISGPAFTQTMLEMAIIAGADVNAAGESGRTPLHWAVGSDNRLAVEILLGHGADKNRTDSFGRSVAALAAELNASKPVKKLLGVARTRRT